MRVRFVSAIALAIAFAVSPAEAATKVSFGVVSPTATTWPGFIAAKKGFFAANGVEMDTVSIGVSPGMQAVASGSLNIMLNTCNAPISFVEAGGTGVHVSLVAMGVHPGVVVGKKGLKGPADIKGQVVGTSSIKSGSTILLRRVLKARGLSAGDYDLVAGQGSAQIFQGLQAGAFAAIWLVPPQSLTAAAGGYPVIGTFKEVAPKFPFVCFVTNDNWVKATPRLRRASPRRGWRRSPGSTIRRTARRRRAILAEALKQTPEIAAATYEELIVKTADAYPRDGKVSLDVLSGMIDVMIEGEELAARPPGDLRRFLDETMLGGK